MSILENSYEAPDRPISKSELISTRKKNINMLKLSTEYLIRHSKCNHVYLCKKYGKKEKLLLEMKSENKDNVVDNVVVDNVDIGNCSVCWKINRTPKDLKYTARSVVNTYMKEHPNMENENNLNHFTVELERVFYHWLYKDNFD